MGARRGGGGGRGGAYWLGCDSTSHIDGGRGADEEEGTWKSQQRKAWDW